MRSIRKMSQKQLFFDKSISILSRTKKYEFSFHTHKYYYEIRVCKKDLSKINNLIYNSKKVINNVGEIKKNSK
jgi:hypothetical protein